MAGGEQAVAKGWSGVGGRKEEEGRMEEGRMEEGRKDGGRKEEGRGQCNNLSETRHASDAAPRHGCLAVSG